MHNATEPTVFVSAVQEEQQNENEHERNFTYRVHSIALLLSKFSIFLNVINLLYDIVAIALSFNDITVEVPNINIIQTVLNITGNVLYVVSTLIAALYGSRTIKKTSTLSIVEEISHRYKHSDLKKKALHINLLMTSTESCSPRSPLSMPGNDSRKLLSDASQCFREALRNNLVSRMGLSSSINLITSLFLYFNVIVYFIMYSGWHEIDARSTRLLNFSMNVINPIVCTVFSYVVVLCDNFNSAVDYTLRVNALILNPPPRIVDAVREINDLTERVEAPLHKQLFEQFDSEDD